MKKIEIPITPVDKMSMADLVNVCRMLEGRKRGKDPIDLRPLSRKKLMEYINSMSPPPRRVPVRQPKKPRMRNRGVGRRVRELLATVIGKTPDDHDEGMSYNDMVSAAQREFPDSMVDERHFRWYATMMRSEGQMIPVHRKRSKWL